jgi:iron complex outermembrane receptor protein
MIDGREVHSSSYTGTNWDSLNIVFEDIERIEVIRGPTPSNWGINSTNGVIHIITKDVRYSQGNHLAFSIGTKENSLEYRYGGRSKDKTIVLLLTGSVPVSKIVKGIILSLQI